jgi:hypothetical protein
MRAGLALAAVSVTLVARDVGAQVHADVDVEAGVSAHFLSSRPPDTGRNPDAGPTFVILGHLAVLPLLRAGLYVAQDFSPLPGADLREFTSGGLSARLFSPWPQGTLRLWLGVGVGYAVGYGSSYSAATTGAATVAVPGAWGGHFEVPLGLGASLHVARRVDLLASVGSRVGFGFTGTLYGTSGSVPAPGEDIFTFFTVVGAAFEL